MSRSLPPLTAIKAFEAAARHGSFKLAAAELYVTPAAVSLQVRQLEEWLGLPLFGRANNLLVLTAKGRAYYPQLTSALNLLASATEQLRGDALRGPLRITALPSFASMWLVPRLGRFRARYPDIELILETDPVSQNLAGRKFDMAIRAGSGRWQGLQAELIARESFTPMCSPALLHGAAPLGQAADLRLLELIHSTPRDGWPRWLELAGVTGVDASKGMTLNDSSLVLQAAIAGQGIALGRNFLAADEIASGRLAAPFALDLANDFSYWLVYPSASASMAPIRAFCDWILAEAAASKRGEPMLRLK